MKNINITFFNFYNGFDITNNVITNSLHKFYNVTIIRFESVLNNPDKQKDIDLVIYSYFGDRTILNNVKCKKLYICGENDWPDFNFADYAITSTYLTYYDRHCRIPYWFIHYYDQTNFIENRKNWDDSLFNREFCSFVVSNNMFSTPLRTSIFNEINKFKSVASGGKYLNNVGGPVDDKHDFISKYKFNIASENSIVDGYVTEKIVDAFNARTIPIYLGTPNIYKEFNPKSFINVLDFKTFRELIEYINEVNTNENLYREMLTCNLFNGENMYEKYKKDLEDFLVHIIEEGQIFNKLYGRIGLKNINNKIYS